MLRTVGQVAGFGAAGVGAGAAYNNPDILEEFFGKVGGLGGAGSSMGRGGGADVGELQGMVGRLSNQVDNLSQTSRHSQSILVQQAQPSTILGVETWKVVGVLGVTGSIYCKIMGYELRDFVYVSKRHFNSVSGAMRKQLQAVDEKVQAVREDLMARLGVVETKVDDAREALEAQFADKFDQVNEEILKVDSSLSRLSALVLATGGSVETIQTEVSSVGEAVAKMANEVQALRSKVGDSDDADIQSRMLALQEGLDRQSNGISLLCQFVVESQGTALHSSSPSLLRQLKDFADETADVSTAVAPPHGSTGRRPVILSRGNSTGLAAIKSTPRLTGASA